MDLDIRSVSYRLPKGKTIDLLALTDIIQNKYNSFYQAIIDKVYEFFDDSSTRTWKDEFRRRFRDSDRYYGPEIRSMGDVYSSPRDKHLYYVCLDVDFRSRTPRASLEIGVFGLGVVDETLVEFQSLIDEYIESSKTISKWTKSVDRSTLMTRLLGSKSATWKTGKKVTKKERNATVCLLEPDSFQTAMWIKKSQGILAKDLEGSEAIVKILVRNGLLTREYVVICKATSRQINRVKSKKDLTEMRRMKVLCSCGRPIEEEIVEELYAPTDLLRQMLDNSYWMSVKVLDILVENGVNPENVVLNIKEGPDEIDVVADIYGRAIMFELKDNEFSMGHAYPFSSRISKFNPHLGVILSLIHI